MLKALAAIVLLFVVAGVVRGGFKNPTTSGSSTVSATAASKASDSPKLENDRGWTASMAIALLKKSLRDPDSLIVDKAIVNDQKVVCIEYRARNGFGGVNRSIVTVNLKAGKMSEDPGYWNKHCLKGDFYDETSAASWTQSLADSALK